MVRESEKASCLDSLALRAKLVVVGRSSKTWRDEPKESEARRRQPNKARAGHRLLDLDLDHLLSSLHSMSSPLTAPALLASLPSLVETASTPMLASPVEALTLLLHATHVALGFRLASVSATGGSEGNQLASEALKKGEIEYKHAQSSLQFVVRVGKLGGRAVVDAMAVEVRDLLAT